MYSASGQKCTVCYLQTLLELMETAEHFRVSLVCLRATLNLG